MTGGISLRYFVSLLPPISSNDVVNLEWAQYYDDEQGCVFCLACSHPELTKDHVLTSAYVKIFRTVTRNAVNKSVPPGKELILAHYL